MIRPGSLWPYPCTQGGGEWPPQPFCDSEVTGPGESWLHECHYGYDGVAVRGRAESETLVGANARCEKEEQRYERSYLC